MKLRAKVILHLSARILFLYRCNAVIHQSAQNYKHRWLTVKSKTEKEFSKIATSPHMARSSRGPPTHTVTVDNMNYSTHNE